MPTYHLSNKWDQTATTDPAQKPTSRFTYPSATILHGASGTHSPPSQRESRVSRAQLPVRKLAICPNCGTKDHHLSVCPEFRQLNPEEVKKWITFNNCCWRCARHHQASDCYLRKTCPKCQGKPLEVLHNANKKKNPGGTSYLIRARYVRLRS